MKQKQKSMLAAIMLTPLCICAVMFAASNNDVGALVSDDVAASIKGGCSGVAETNCGSAVCVATTMYRDGSAMPNSNICADADSDPCTRKQGAGTQGSCLTCFDASSIIPCGG